MNKVLLTLLAALALTACTPPPGGYGPPGGSDYGVDDTVKPDTETEAKARVFTELASGYYVRGQYKIVLENLLKAVKAEPRFAPAYNLYGLVYMNLDEYGLAEENFKKALALTPNDSETRNNYGYFLCQRGRYDEGLAELSQAIRNPLYSHIETATLNSGLCGELKGDLELAERNYVRTLKLTPDNGPAMEKLAGVRYKQARYRDAAALLDQLKQLSPRMSADALWLAVRTEHLLGDKNQEQAYIRQLRGDFPDSDYLRKIDAGQFE